jgi:tetratricopeptide (TPR) repeat protein
MKKLFTFLLFTATWCSIAVAQKNDLDSLQKAYQKNKQDTTLTQIYFLKSATVFLTTNVDSGSIYARKALVLSRKIHFKKGEVRALSMIAIFQHLSGDLPGALKSTFDILPKATALHEMRVVASCYNTRGLIYSILNEHQKSLNNYYSAKNVAEKYHYNDLIITELNNISRAYLDYNKLDSAAYFSHTGYDFALKHDQKRNLGYLIRNFGIIEFKKGNMEGAIAFYRKSLQDSSAKDNPYLKSEDYRRIAEAYNKMNKPDSSIHYAQAAFEEAKLDRNPDLVQKAATLLTNAFNATADY